MGSDRDVSVIIVTYNSLLHIGPCLDALYLHSHGATDVVVYDNGSTDGTTRLVRERYQQVTLVEGTENLGYAAANNRAASVSEGQFLVFLNPDTIVEWNWLPPLIAVLLGEGIGATTPQIVFADAPDRINALGNAIHFSGIAYCWRFGQVSVQGEPCEVGAVSGAAFVIRREVFERIGGFEESFFLYYEDTDLSLRLRRMGLQIMAVPSSVIRHDYRAAFAASKVYYLERNRYLSLLSLLGWPVLVLMLPSLLLAELTSWVYCALHGRAALAAKGRAWRDIIRLRRWVWARRQQCGQMPTDWACLLRAFSPRLDVQYAGGGSSLAFALLEAASAVAAAPMLALARAVLNRYSPPSH